MSHRAKTVCTCFTLSLVCFSNDSSPAYLHKIMITTDVAQLDFFFLFTYCFY